MTSEERVEFSVPCREEADAAVLLLVGGAIQKFMIEGEEHIAVYPDTALFSLTTQFVLLNRDHHGVKNWNVLRVNEHIEGKSVSYVLLRPTAARAVAAWAKACSSRIAASGQRSGR